MPLESGGLAVVAAGTLQTDAAAAYASVNVVSAANDAKGVILPSANAGELFMVCNTVANKILLVYPESGGKIDVLATDGAYSLPAATNGLFFCAASTIKGGAGAQWRSVTGTLPDTDNFVNNAGAGTAAAAGSNQANAAVLSKSVNVVSGADDAKGVSLPVGVAGDVVTVVTTVNAKNLLVYASVGGKINGGSVDAAYTLAGIGSATFVCSVGGAGSQWWANKSA